MSHKLSYSQWNARFSIPRHVVQDRRLNMSNEASRKGRMGPYKKTWGSEEECHPPDVRRGGHYGVENPWCDASRRRHVAERMYRDLWSRWNIKSNSVYLSMHAIMAIYPIIEAKYPLKNSWSNQQVVCLTCVSSWLSDNDATLFFIFD